ncbi:hypothetical protein J2W56_001274 [Nocardia kruczakiae]|uniref:Secreted protein n=1 Tax=Nocardia kruczakiae TaxID=261477 RepID=A0ABU1XAK0_9NOCA|nr:hypothetical protein [Nocardia kruczakiae]MDR7167555.1 hypothetical protein [Nocardia kruczakiae]
MNTRMLALGIASGAICAAIAALAPSASAQPFPAGVSCTETTCTNDTDETYLIEAWQHCRVVGGISETETPFDLVVRAHRTVRVEGVKCPPVVIERPGHSGGTDTTVLATEPTRISYFKAVRHDPDAPKVRTGSAG